MLFKKFFERRMAEFFAGLGRVVGRTPYTVISLCLTVCVVLSVGFVRFEEVNSVRTEYSPMDSPSRKEYEVAKSFLNQNGTLDPSYVMVFATDGGSLLRETHRHRLIELTKTLQDNVTVDIRGKSYEFRDLCEPYCELNTAFLAFLKLYDPENPSTYTYPQVEIFGTQAFIGKFEFDTPYQKKKILPKIITNLKFSGNNVYGITLKNGTKQITAFTTAILPFYLVTTYENANVIYKWVIAAREAFREERFNILRFCEITGDSLVSAEVRRMGLETAPMIALSVLAMILFVVCFSFRSSATVIIFYIHRRDPSRAKPWESLVGCLIPLLALLSTTGLLCWCGWKFQSIIVAAFFLVLSVGVDDVFIILRAWDRTSADDEVPERMAITLEESGPSILISSITNAMAFFIGMMSQTPAVRSFSLYSAIAITICFFYQLIMFSAVLAASGYRERNGLQSFLCWKKANPKARSVLVERVVWLQNIVIRHYSRFICTWFASYILFSRIILVVIMGCYYYASTVGIMQLRTLITIEKMALPDSYLQSFQDTFESSLKNMQPISVFVMNPGDLRDPQRLATIKRIVADFENATYSYGSESTFFWIQAYEDFLNHIKYHELIPAVKDWRRIAAKYPDYQVYAYSDHSPFVDQTLAIDSTVWSSMGAALLCTAIACFVFIPNLACIITACFSVLSITVGILGLLSLWVVFPFLVSFHAREKGDQNDPALRVEDALACIGWPLMQVGLSTILAIAPPLLKPSYMVLVFMKTIVVVCSLGMFHGLVVMPVILTAVTRRKDDSW
ncbi:patched family protein [Necator americanus]|uniref:Patched family protein n=1 Tax=Necator americanus TaxID=51031 RepID=W2TBD3_NECAM|nr:patched family protein [Necator americanus]ETN78297.1 patched family protein [Necator americanus]